MVTSSTEHKDEAVQLVGLTSGACSSPTRTSAAASLLSQSQVSH